MVTSGTGHDLVAASLPGPTGARTPPEGSDGKISKIIFGFKRVAKNFEVGLVARAGSSPPGAMVNRNRSRAVRFVRLVGFFVVELPCSQDSFLTSTASLATASRKISAASTRP